MIGLNRIHFRINLQKRTYGLIIRWKGAIIGGLFGNDNWGDFSRGCGGSYYRNFTVLLNTNKTEAQPDLRLFSVFHLSTFKVETPCHLLK